MGGLWTCAPVQHCHSLWPYFARRISELHSLVFDDGPIGRLHPRSRGFRQSGSTAKARNKSSQQWQNAFFSQPLSSRHTQVLSPGCLNTADTVMFCTDNVTRSGVIHVRSRRLWHRSLTQSRKVQILRLASKAIRLKAADLGSTWSRSSNHHECFFQHIEPSFSPGPEERWCHLSPGLCVQMKRPREEEIDAGFAPMSARSARTKTPQTRNRNIP